MHKTSSDGLQRCAWVDGSELYTRYHDEEWGRAVHNDNKLFEMLVLESFQAGLSWITILKKREHFREAFDGFDPELVALYDEEKIAELVTNPLIIRHRGKIRAAIHNAKLFLDIVREYGSFDQFVWRYVDHEPLVSGWKDSSEVPATTALSDQMSRDLKKRGFKFFGPTIAYSFMQATGMVNDHTQDCFLCTQGESSCPKEASCD